MEVKELCRRLSERYDVREWWPAESRWEIMVGAILVQQTTWESVEKVLGDMTRRGLMDVDAVAALPREELERSIRPAGFYRQTATRLQHLARYLQQHYASDPGGILNKDAGEARKELLALPGIGEETADAILLFGGKRPKFIAAAYVRRILGRMGMLHSDDYGEVQRFMEARLPPDPEEYARSYALLVHHARTACRSRPRCAGCCLRDACTFTV
jgi:endonuclease III related protein